MIEWIVLVWVAVSPPYSNRVSISSDTASFQQTWDSLSQAERKTARVFRGEECSVLLSLAPEKN